MNKYLIFVLLPNIAGVNAMELPNYQKTEQYSVQSADECFICTQTAEEIAEENIENIYVTNCCKQFVCDTCIKQLKESNVKQCPYCRHEGLKATPAIVEKPSTAEQLQNDEVKQEEQKGEYINALYFYYWNRY